MPWFINLLIGLALNIIAYLIMPKPKPPKPPAVTDMSGPTAEAGRPVPVVFGTVLVKSPNIIWWAERTNEQRKVKDKPEGGKK